MDGMDDGDRLAVIGAGTMGHGIAQVAAAARYRTLLVDVDPAALARGMRGIESGLDRAVEKGKLDPEERGAILARVTAATDLEAAAAGADIVIEAVPESLDLKRDLFRRLDAAAPPRTLLATNTSSLPVSEIAAATRTPERVVGMHFFNPVPVMALLEVIRGSATAPEAVARAVAVGKRMGKECIVVRDSPGFATSRLGVLLGLEAIRMFEEGVASAEDIDKAMTLGYRHPVGPLRLTDLVGLDVRLAIAEHLHLTLGSAAFDPPRTLREMVAAGNLGKKSGRGFYSWE
jgi:3-hydroxybutyryl-CoA dehydrogenase